MNSSIIQDIQRHIPLVGDVNTKSPIAYQATRIANAAFNAISMAGAEAYINGRETPDPVVKSFFDASVQICYKYFPSLLVPYEWLLKESDRLSNLGY